MTEQDTIPTINTPKTTDNATLATKSGFGTGAMSSDRALPIRPIEGPVRVTPIGEDSGIGVEGV
jgi:hypothetical protein